MEKDPGAEKVHVGFIAVIVVLGLVIVAAVGLRERLGLEPAPSEVDRHAAFHSASNFLKGRFSSARLISSYEQSVIAFGRRTYTIALLATLKSNEGPTMVALELEKRGKDWVLMSCQPK